MTGHPIQGLVSPSDVAELAGVSRGAVSNWRKRHNDFPEAVGGSPSKPLFDRSAIVAWLKRNGREVKEMPAGHLLWSALNDVRDVLPVDQAVQLLLFLATAKQASRLPGFARAYDEFLTAERDHDELLLGWAEQIEHAVPSLRERIGVWSARNTSGKAVDKLARAIDALPERERASAIDQCLESASRWLGKSGGEHGFVGSRTTGLLRALVPANAETVYDPACGIASALLSITGSGRSRRLVGHDISPDALGTAAQRAFLHGVDLELALGNVLVADPDAELRADVIIAEPPLGIAWDAAAALTDPRFAHGVPSRSAADLAWIQHVIAHLATNGRGYVLTANGALSRRGRDAEVRSRLIAAGCIEAVVQLPSKLLPSTSIPLALWVVRPECAATDVLLVEASDATDLESEIPQALRSEHEPEDGAEVRWRRIAIPDLIADGSRLTPAHWIESDEIDPGELMDHLRSAAARLGRAITSVASSAPRAPELDSDPRSRVATVGRLIDDGVVDLARGRSEARYSDDEWVQNRVLRASDVRDGRLPLQDVAADDPTPTGEPSQRDRIEAPSAVNRASTDETTQAGDVLVTTMNEVRTLLDEVGGHLPSTGVDALRVTNKSVLRAGYLAAALTGSWNERFRAGTTIQRIPIRDLEVPMLPLHEQESVEASFLGLARVRRDALAAASEALSLQSAILDAVRYNVPLPELNLDAQSTVSETQESE